MTPNLTANRNLSVLFLTALFWLKINLWVKLQMADAANRFSRWQPSK